MASGSTKVVLTALFGNLAIAVSKLSASLYTGSSAMLAEGAHSLVDTGNQALLLVGLKRAQRPADANHPFGYGKEIYFWSFVVAVLLFSLGAGFSIYEGVAKIQDPHPVESPWVNYVVLTMAIGFEGFALNAAVREMNRMRRPGESVFAYTRRSKDAALFTVLFEDMAAMLGILFAFLGLIAAHALDAPIFDGVATLAIGLLLAGAAVMLAWETKGLLIGESADPALVARIRALAAADQRVDRVNEVLTMHLGPNDVLAAVSLDFKPEGAAVDVEDAVSELERALKAEFPELRRIFIEAQHARDHKAATEMKPA